MPKKGGRRGKSKVSAYSIREIHAAILRSTGSMDKAAKQLDPSLRGHQLGLYLGRFNLYNKNMNFNFLYSCKNVKDAEEIFGALYDKRNLLPPTGFYYYTLNEIHAAILKEENIFLAKIGEELGVSPTSLKQHLENIIVDGKGLTFERLKNEFSQEQLLELIGYDVYNFRKTKIEYYQYAKYRVQPQPGAVMQVVTPISELPQQSVVSSSPVEKLVVDTEAQSPQEVIGGNLFTIIRAINRTIATSKTQEEVVARLKKLTAKDPWSTALSKKRKASIADEQPSADEEIRKQPKLIDVIEKEDSVEERMISDIEKVSQGSSRCKFFTLQNNNNNKSDSSASSYDNAIL